MDRLYGYESNPRKDIYQHLKTQSNNVQLEFKERFNKIVGEFAEQVFLLGVFKLITYCEINCFMFFDKFLSTFKK